MHDDPPGARFARRRRARRPSPNRAPPARTFTLPSSLPSSCSVTPGAAPHARRRPLEGPCGAQRVAVLLQTSHRVRRSFPDTHAGGREGDAARSPSLRAAAWRPAPVLSASAPAWTSDRVGVAPQQLDRRPRAHLDAVDLAVADPGASGSGSSAMRGSSSCERPSTSTAAARQVEEQPRQAEARRRVIAARKLRGQRGGLSLALAPPGRVAQLARAPRLHRGGRPFESGRAHPPPRDPLRR